MTKYDKMPSTAPSAGYPTRFGSVTGGDLIPPTTGPGSCTAPGASVSITCYWGLQLEVNIAVGIVRVKDLAAADQSLLVP